MEKWYLKCRVTGTWNFLFKEMFDFFALTLFIMNKIFKNGGE